MDVLPSRRASFALLALRLGLGGGLLSHGTFVLARPDFWAAAFARVGVPVPSPALPFLGAAAALAGLLVLVGVGSRVAAFALAPWFLAWSGFAIVRGFGWGLPLACVGGLLTLAILGPGAFAVRPRAPPAWLAASAPFGLFPIRVAAGTVMVDYGVDKLLRFGPWMEDFAALGIPLPPVTVALVAVAELFGGLGLVAGVLVRFSSAVLSVVLAAAILVAWLPRPPWAGWDFDLVLLGGLVALALTGAGRPTLGSMLGKEWGDPEERLHALAARVGSKDA